MIGHVPGASARRSAFAAFALPFVDLAAPLGADFVLSALRGRALTAITSVNVDILRIAEVDAEFRRLLLGTEALTVDSWVLAYILRMAGRPAVPPVSGHQLFVDSARLLAAEGARVAWFGAAPGIAAAAAQASERRWPGLQCGWVGDGFADRAGSWEKVAASGSTVVLVALPSPLKERWIAEARRRAPRLRLAIGVGGGLDILAGRRHAAPERVSRLGLEWAWRAAQDPRRLGPRYVKDLMALPALLRRLSMDVPVGPSRTDGHRH